MDRLSLRTVQLDELRIMAAGENRAAVAALAAELARRRAAGLGAFHRRMNGGMSGGDTTGADVT